MEVDMNLQQSLQANVLDDRFISKYAILPDSILEQGQNLVELGVYEYAWKKEQVESILQILKEKQVPVLGGDVYRVENGNIDSTCDSWFLEDDGSSDYLERSFDKTLSYINDYELTNGKGYLYTIVF